MAFFVVVFKDLRSCQAGWAGGSRQQCLFTRYEVSPRIQNRTVELDTRSETQLRAMAHARFVPSHIGWKPPLPKLPLKNHSLSAREQACV